MYIGLTYFGLPCIKKGSMKKENTQVFKPKKKRASKKLSPAMKKMALKYEAALQKCTEELSPWKIEAIKEDPRGRHARPFYREVARLAESEGFEPKRVVYAGAGTPTPALEPSMLSGKAPPSLD